jgi:hypothetical protein
MLSGKEVAARIPAANLSTKTKSTQKGTLVGQAVTVCALEAGNHGTESHLAKDANAHVQLVIHQSPSDLSGVERRINAVTYVMKRSPKQQPLVVPVDKLKPFQGMTSHNWSRYLSNKSGNSDHHDVSSTETTVGGNASGQLAGPAVGSTLAQLTDSAMGIMPGQMAGPLAENVPGEGNTPNQLASLEAYDAPGE